MRSKLNTSKTELLTATNILIVYENGEKIFRISEKFKIKVYDSVKFIICTKLRHEGKQYTSNNNLL